MRDLLVTALEKPGAGDLIHPYYGKVSVSVDGEFEVSESSAEGGYCKISLKFVEAGLIVFPTASNDTAFQLGASADAANAAASSDFNSAFSIAQQPGFVVAQAAAKVSSFSDTLSAATSNVSGTAAGISDLAFSIKNLKGSAKTILATPALLSAQMTNAFALLASAANPSDVFAAGKAMFGFGDSDAPIPPSTPTRVVEAQNTFQQNSLTQVLATTSAAVAAGGVTYSSSDDAVTARDQVTAQIDKLMESGISDALYNALQDLRTKVTISVPAPGQDLATITTVTPPATTNSIVLTYGLYGSQDLEQDVIDRNRISHPGFIQGAQTLEVLDSDNG